jgi:predicted acyl esterase
LSKEEARNSLPANTDFRGFEVRGIVTLIEDDPRVYGFLSPCNEPEAIDVAFERSRESDRQAFETTWNEALADGLSAREYEELLGDAMFRGAFGWMLKIEVDNIVAVEVEPQECDTFLVRTSNTRLEITSTRLIGTVRLVGEN